MQSLISKLGCQLNPRNDVQCIREYVFGHNDISTFYRAMKPIAQLASKPVLRGGVCGAIIGGGISYFIGYDVQEGAENGVFFGMTLDTIQMFIRLI